MKIHVSIYFQFPFYFPEKIRETSTLEICAFTDKIREKSRNTQEVAEKSEKHIPYLKNRFSCCY